MFFIAAIHAKINPDHCNTYPMPGICSYFNGVLVKHADLRGQPAVYLIVAIQRMEIRNLLN